MGSLWKYREKLRRNRKFQVMWKGSGLVVLGKGVWVYWIKGEGR